VVGAGACLALGACAPKGLLVVEVHPEPSPPAAGTLELRAGGYSQTYALSEPEIGLYLPAGTYSPEVLAFDSAHQQVASGRYPTPVRIAGGDTVIIAIDLIAAANVGTGAQDGGPGDGAGERIVDADHGTGDVSFEGPPDVPDDHPVPDARDSGADGVGEGPPSGDGLTDGDQSPLPAACVRDAAAAAAATVYTEGFESCATAAVDSCPGWIRASMGFTSGVTSTWVFEGAKNIELGSYTMTPELVYTIVSIPPTATRISLELVYTPDGSFISASNSLRDFGALGLARSTPGAKFSPTRLLGLRVQEHDLMVKVAPGAWVAGTPWQGQVVFQEMLFARLQQNETPQHNRIRIEVDRCARTAAIYAGAVADPLTLRMTIPTGDLGTIDSIFLEGGYDATFYDSIVVQANTP